MINLFNYIDRPSSIHRLTGASKLVCLLAWSLAAMTSFYTPLLILMTAASFVLFRLAKLKMKDSMAVTVAGNDERILLIAVYDNLGKGASGAAVECMNVVLGADKTCALDI